MEKTIILKPKKISIDDLAIMVNNGFKTAHNDLIKVKEELVETQGTLKQEIDDLRKNMEFRFNGVSNQLDRIYLDYTTRQEHTLTKERLKRVERKVGIQTLN